MRTPEDVLVRLQKRLGERWAADVWSETGPATDSTLTTALGGSDDGAGATCDALDEEGGRPWPYSVPLGRPTSAELGTHFATFLRQVHDWRAWATRNGVRLDEQARRVAGAQQLIPSHVVVADLDEAARLLGTPWLDLMTVARARARTIRDQFPHAVNPVRAVRAAAQLGDVDFDIALRVAAWFAACAAEGHPAGPSRGFTPRQVPIEGVHAKWLNNHHALVRNLAGLDDLGLAPGHPPRIHFTYLDRDHLAKGRRHDSYSVGDDKFELPYTPRVIVISENKDTAVGFPCVPGGIAVEGAGNGGGTIAATPWIRDAPLVIYWGDLDVDGLRILNEFRASGVEAVSILMDRTTYDTYARYGTNADKNGKPIASRPGPDPVHLNASERDLYDHLTSLNALVRRVEQERIPLTVALERVEALCTVLPAPPVGSHGPDTAIAPRQVNEPAAEAMSAETASVMP